MEKILLHIISSIRSIFKKIFIPLLGIFLVIFLILSYIVSRQSQMIQLFTKKNENLQKAVAKAQKEEQDLKNQDQYKINQKLMENIKNIETTYQQASKTYENIVDLKSQKQDTGDLDKEYALLIKQLAEKNYASGSSTLTTLSSDVKKIQDKLAAAAAASQIAANAPFSNTPAGSGYNVQQVQTDSGSFAVAIIAADLGSTRVIVDTASDSDCSNNCPTLPLADYVARNGAYAGINGSFFCPAEYPSCAGKTNSFDLLVMNKNKHYFNSSNNVYSTNPAVIFGSGWIRFVGRALEWGRDTGVDGVLSNFPMLVSGGNVVYGDSSDPKFLSRGPRGFVANRGNTVYIGFVLGATMGESAKTLKALGMENAMNLDEGGSTALWFGGYKLGPGRNLADAILFLRK